MTVDPVVQINDGTLRGKLWKDSNGDRVYAFLGVPYAKPPIGDLRFKAPQPVEPWEGIKEVVEDTPPCAQFEFMVSREYLGEEDCLYLNVFTKSLSDAQPLKPVLVFFHGGGYTMGSNKTKSYSPNFLITEDIVFVAINYRLGILGFLSLDDTSLEVHGNAGLKDQNMALKWIQSNIHKFGGDKDNVTISGESAGGASVNYHMLSPSSKGLFHKGILQSGSVFNPWPHLNPKWRDMIKYLGMDWKNDSELLEILKKTPVRELIEAQLKWMDELEDSYFRYFAPCVEKPNPTAFLTRKPVDIIVSGDYYKVPMIIGFNSNEGLYAYLDKKEYDNFKNRLIMPAQILLPNDAAKKEYLINKIQSLYRSEKYRNNLFQATGDSMFTAGIIGLAQHFVKTCPEPIYFYEFDMVASRNKFRKMLKIGEQYPGASHVDELGYLYEGQLFNDSPFVQGSIEDITIRRFVKFWCNFMKYGNPTPNHEELNFTWKPMTKDSFNYLHFTEELNVKTNPAEDRMLLWREIYKSHEETKDFMP